MKKEYLSLSIFLILLMFFSCKHHVVAIDSEVACSYKIILDNSDEKVEERIFTIGDDSSFPFYGGSQQSDSNPNYGNNTVELAYAYDIPFLGDYTIATEAYEKIGCPQYFYVLRDYNSNSWYGYFSIISPEQFEFKYGYAYSNLVDKYELVDAEVKEQKDGVMKSKDKLYSCELGAQVYNGKSYTTKLTINYTKKKITFSNGIIEDLKGKYLKNFNYKEKNKCPEDLYVCYSSFDDTEATISSNRNYSDFCYSLQQTKTKIKSGVRYCQIYSDLLAKYKSEEKLEETNESVDTLLQLKNFCKNETSLANYSSYEYSCIYKCLHMDEDLPLSLSDSSDCGLSHRIIAFIYNVLKWVKYIAPVLVIILGILDFVKALVAQDDDAMKKAQGKFVKRLVAAVLLFLLPLIIDYVLSIFNLVKDSCNINEIF